MEDILQYMNVQVHTSCKFPDPVGILPVKRDQILARIYGGKKTFDR